jgi:hypothetical protein
MMINGCHMARGARAGIRIVVVAFAVACVGMAGAAWQDPDGGWDHEYEADSTRLLPAAFDGSWLASWIGFANHPELGTTSAAIVEDGAEGGVLEMVNRGRGDAMNSHFRMEDAPGSGTPEDKVVLDFRFRLTDDSQPEDKEQFMVSVKRPWPDDQGGSFSFVVGFASNAVIFYDGQNRSAVDADIGTASYHDARLRVDVKEGEAALYLDGSDEPVATFAPIFSPDAGNNIQFGDGSAGVEGGVNLRFIRWANNGFEGKP